MRLSLVCFFKKTVNGHIFRGKDRLVKRVGKSAMETLRNEYERQEKNMLLLRHPYLTPEESSGHTKNLGRIKARIDKFNEEHLKTVFKPHIKIEDRLNHLKIQEGWE